MNKIALIAIFWLVFSGATDAQNFVYQNIISSNDTTFCPPDSIDILASGSSCLYIVDTIAYSPYSVGGTSPSMYDDSYTSAINIGFTFDFYCNSYTQFYLSSNGWISFTPITAASGWNWNYTPNVTTDIIPSTTGNVPKNCIMGPWKDWTPSGSNYIYYQTQGSAPNRRLVVSWASVPMYGCSSTTGTFQIVLHETSNLIENFLTVTPYCSSWQAPNYGWGTQAIHDQNGTSAEICNSRNATVWTATNEGWKYDPGGIVWVWQGDTVGFGPSLHVSQTGFYPSTCGYAYAYIDSLNGNIAYDSILISPLCSHPELNVKDVECTGDSSGYIVAIDTSNSSGPWEFTWFDASNNVLRNVTSNNNMDTLSGLGAGVYTVRILGNEGACFLVYGSDTVFEPEEKNAFVGFVPVLCNGDATGIGFAIDTNDYSGLSTWDGLYTYTWTNSSNTIIDFVNQVTLSSDSTYGLVAGTYNVTIDGCFIQTGSITVTEPPTLTAGILNPSKTSCPDGLTCDASALAVGNGGVTPYSYLWTSGEVTSAAIGLCPGSNSVIITDANGCDTAAFVVIGIPDSIVTTSYGDTTMCITNIAGIAATSTGGTPPYSYAWMESDLLGDTVSWLSTASVNPVVTTSYIVSSTDSNGCPGDTASVHINVRPELGLILPLIDTICPYDTIDITAVGLGGDSIYTYSWSSGTFGPKTTISPDLPTWFFVTVSDACGTPQYVDSVFVQVGGYSPIRTKIRVEDDSICAGENVYLIASGRGGFKGPQEYRFKWNQSSWDGNPIQFSQPAKTTTYIVTITDLCLSPAGSDTVLIYVGEPEAPHFWANPNISCKDADVSIYFNTWKPNYKYNWNLGDGDFVFNAKSDTIKHRYGTAGCYDVTLSVTTDFGCFAERTEKCLVEILQSPMADYIHFPENPTTVEPHVQFRDNSSFAEHIQWYIDQSEYGSDDVFRYEFIDTGWYSVTLIATSEDGCTDTTTKLLHNSLEQTIYIPLSFSPNGDGLNDIFSIVGEGIQPEGFEFVVYDRWGHKIFYTKNPSFGWDGKRIAGGEMVNSGSYPYILKYIDKYNEPKRLTGQILVGKTGDPSGLK